MLQQVMTGKWPMVPKVGMPIVDVRNVAEAHVNAIEKGVNGARYLMNCQEDFIWLKDWTKVLKDEFEGTEYKASIKEAPYCLLWMSSICDNSLNQFLVIYGKKFSCEQKRVQEDLGVNYISMEQSTKEMAHNLIDIGYIEDKRINKD